MRAPSGRAIAGVRTRDTSKAFRMGRGIKAGRVWTNCYHLYPAGAAFGACKASGVGRVNHKRMLDHYTQTKRQLVSYDLVLCDRVAFVASW